MSEVHRYNVVTMLSAAGATIGYDPHGPEVVMAADFDRITAERDAILLQVRAWAGEAKAQRATVNEVGAILGGIPDWGPIAAKVGDLQQILNVADQRADDVRTQLEALEQRRRAEFEAGQAAERRVEVLEGLLRRVVASSVLSFERDAPEELEGLEVDICAALKPTAEGASHE